jgi:hypothetical protein
MNYRELIMQSWQIVRQNKRIWLFSFLSTFCAMTSNLLYEIFPISPGAEVQSGFSPFLYFLVSIFLFVNLFIGLFSAYGMLYCAAMAVYNREYKLSDVWNTFKSNLLKLAFLNFFTTVYILVLYLLHSLIVRTIITSVMASNYAFSFWRNESFYLIFVLYGAPVMLSEYGVIFQKMGVFQSLMNGIKVFSGNRKIFVAISLIPYMINVMISVIVFLSLILVGPGISYENYNSMRSSTPIDVFIYFVTFFISPIFIASFTSTYFKISPIQD